MVKKIGGIQSSNGIKQNIITKVLEKQGLTSKYTNPRTLQVFYHVTKYKPMRQNLGNSIFIVSKGVIDNAFLKDVMNVVEHQIKACSSMKGISSSELQDIIRESGLTKESDGVPLNDIERVLQLLEFENKIRIVPGSLPLANGDLSRFLTPSQNTFHHLVKGMQELRDKRRDRIQEEQQRREMARKREMRREYNAANAVRGGRDMEPLPKRRKLDTKSEVKSASTDSSKLKIEIDGSDDDKDKVKGDGGPMDAEWREIEKFGNVRFRFNHYEYDSPFSEVPCQSCPVANTCSDDGIVNPKSCPYLNAWLDLF